MSAADWYIALFSLGSGLGILGFWAAVTARGRVHHVAAGRRDIAFHVAAELVTGAVLIAAGIAIIDNPDSREAIVMSTLGLGLLLYSLLQSPGHYLVEKDWRMVATFAVTWLFAIPAIVLRFVS